MLWLGRAAALVCLLSPLGASAFHREGVEAAPDSLLPAPAGHSRRQLPYTATGAALTPFYRGNIEGKGEAPLHYYGAAAGRTPVLSTRPHVEHYGAAYYNTREVAPPTGEAPHPLRASVEQRPEGVGRRGAARALPLYRQPFPQARRGGQVRAAAYGAALQGRSIARQASYKLVCYYGAWSVYRPAPSNFRVGDIDPFSCTHLIYSFSGLATNLTMVSLDPEEDVTKGSYKAAVALKEKNPNLKVMLAIGGWNEGGAKYSAMVATAKGREDFIWSVVSMLGEFGFDGLDLDWEYPGATDRDGKWGDKDNFAKLVEELADAFKTVGKGWLLSAAVSAAKFRVEEGYAVARISKHLDFINVMTYDLHGDWDNFADHHAPLHAREHDSWEFQALNTHAALAFWASKGAPREKLLLGTPFYGRSFTLAGAGSGPGAQSSGPGAGGKFTEEPGFLAYAEICQLLAEGGWEEHQDSDGNQYIVKGDQWVGYDTVANVRRKMEYVMAEGLGGAMVWAIDLDDYRGDCGPRWPLLSQMNLSLRPLGGPVIPDTTAAPQDADAQVPGIVAAVEVEDEEEEYEELQQLEELEEEDDFECPSQGLHRSTTDCAVYYNCLADGSHFRFPCPSGLYFDPSISACNWAEEVACEVGPAPLLYTDSVCSGLADGTYSDPHRSSGYFLCTAGARHRRSCPPGLHFDAASGACRDKHQAEFHPGVVVRAQAASSPLLLSSPDKKVVCYFSNWSGLRAGDGQYLPEHLQPSLCSHVVYAFATLDEETLTPRPSAPKADIESGYYRRLVEAVGRGNPSARVLLSLGGWADSAGDKYSRLVASPAARAAFVTSTVEFLLQHGFQGLVLEWHFPVCWQSDCSKGPSSDKPGLAALAKELRDAFDGEDLTLAATLSGYMEVIDKAYDVRKLGVELDFMNIMTYDWRGYWDGRTGHHSPIHRDTSHEDGYTDDFNIDAVMAYYEQLGAPKNKLVLGIPFYGQSFTTRGNAVEYGAPVSGPGKAGKFTQQKGMLAYHEVCTQLRSGELTASAGNDWRGPYAYGSSGQWVGYDDTDSVAAKADLVKTKGWAGAAVWTLDLDDFNNLCCGGASPLLSTVSRALRGVGEVGGGCGHPPPPATPPPRPSTTTERYDDGSGSTTSATPATPGRPSVAPVVAETTSRSTTSGWDDYQWSPQDYDTYEYSGQWAHSSTTPATGAASTCREGEGYPDPGDCQKYFRCQGGHLQLQACAGGLYWNSQAAMCDWADGTQCQVAKVEPEQVEQVEEVLLGGCEGGEYTPVAGDCRSFYQCVEGKREVKQCAAGLHWNDDKKVCDWEAEAGCRSQPRLVTTGCQEGTLSNDPSSCPAYFMCVHGKLQPFQCQAGTDWDNTQQVCNHPEFVGCSGGVAGSAPSAPAPTTARPPSAPSTAANEAQVDSEEEPQAWKPDYDSYEYTPWTPSTTTWEPDWASVPEVSPLSGDFKVVCYFTNWAWYRPGVGKYRPEDIDPTLCTHIIYGFAVLDSTTLTMKPHDSWADIDNNFYKKVTEFKKYGIKVSVAIGGWNDSKGNKYSRLVNSPAARRKFITNVVKFIEEWNFDGLDLDWEYPSCWQTECKEERYKDQAAFAAWVRELKAELAPRGLLLSAAVSPSKKIIEVGYDVASIARDLDWINVMTYDYHGHWDKKTGHVAPFSEHPEDDFYYFNLKYTIDFWLQQGAPREKLVVGMPLYGQAFTLDSDTTTGLNSPARRKGAAGQFTRAAGFLAYYEICHDIGQGGWTVVQDPHHRMGPYAFKDRHWVGYDDAAMIRRKSEYVREQGLGGGMVWALDLDDFQNRCGEGPHPLMHAMTAVLGPARGQYAPTASKELTGPSVQQTGEASETEETPETEPIISEDYDEYNGLPGHLGEGEKDKFKVVPEDGYKVVCYFTNWAWYRPGTGKYKPEDIQADLCTHIVYGFAVLDPNTHTIRAHDSWADFDNNFYKQVTAFKSANKKVLLALGGWNDSKGKKYSELVSSPSSRAKFVANAVDFLTEHNFDGLDLDWEYPVCWQVDCSAGPATDKANFAAWVRELSTALSPKGLLLTAAVSPSNKVMDAGYDIPALDRYLDYISVMTYDYHGQWDKQTGHVAPMFQHVEDKNIYFNTNYTVNYWLQGGLRKSKLIMGMPMYGQSFTLTSAAKNSLNSETYGGGTAGRFTRARGFLAYYEICDYVLNQGWTVVSDPAGTMGPYAYKGNQWVSFDDTNMIRFKSKYVKEMGLGGAMIWALDLDDFRNVCGCESHPLLKTINRELRGLDTRGEDCSLRGNYRSLSTAQELSPSPYNSCPDGPFSASPSSCSQYLECDSLGQYVARECPAGLHWNHDHCDWPEAADCKAGTAPPQTAAVIAETQQPVQGHRPGGQVDIAEVVEPVPVPEGITVPDTGMKVVCYYTNWAWYRQGVGKYKPEDIDWTLCTHINYGFAVLDPTSLTMVAHDSWADIDNDFYKKVTALKKKGVVVAIALGGWNDSEGDKYSRMVSQPSSRATFIRAAVEFIEKWGFEGLDLDWEYPKCWQVDCSLGPAADKENFAALVRELREEFTPRGWTLSAAVSPSKTVMDEGYDIPALSRDLDIINVMTYDYHGHWDKKTGHVAPLYTHPEDEFYFFNANYTMNYWAEKGADRRKLMMGMPMYGQSFALASAAAGQGLNSPAPGRGQAGEFTRAAGFLAYYEICHKVRSGGWLVTTDPEGRLGPTAQAGNQWVGYDDIATIRRKSQFIKDQGFGGGMIWALDLDDFSNRCGCENYPLLRTINRVLRDYPTPDPRCDGPQHLRGLTREEQELASQPAALPYTLHSTDSQLPTIQLGDLFQ